MTNVVSTMTPRISHESALCVDVEEQLMTVSFLMGQESELPPTNITTIGFQTSVAKSGPTRNKSLKGAKKGPLFSEIGTK